MNKRSLPLLLVLFCSYTVFSQINTYIKSVRPASAMEGDDLRMTAQLQLKSDIALVSLHYRPFGQTEYKEIEMQMIADSASVIIPSTEVLPPFLEYYVVIQTVYGSTESLPFESPAELPARVQIEPRPITPSEILITSPSEGERVIAGQTYISISFVYANNDVNISSTKISINGIDLSNSKVVYGDLVIIPPEAIPENALIGAAQLSIEVFDTAGTSIKSLSRNFKVLTTKEAEEEKTLFEYGGSLVAESRNEDIKGAQRTYNRLDARLNSKYGNYVKGNILLGLSSEEKPENQPQNRYFAGIDARYLKLGFGDAYPRFPTLVMDGRRVRGFSGEINTGFFNYSVSTGEIIRSVRDSLPRTLRRTIKVHRPNFGKGEYFQWGFTYAKAIDEFSLTDSLIVKPQENMVIGTDLMFAFDDRRIEFTSQASFSLTNIDISSASFTADSVDSAAARGTLTKGDADNLKKMLPIASKFITLNENLIPISPQGLTSAVYEMGLSFNYFGNYLKGMLLFHGKDYTSFGASSFRQDIKGFNISDRLRLFSNRLFLTVSHEVLQNNTAGTEVATTTYKTTNASVSFFPPFSFPTITTGVSLQDNSNPIDPFDTVGVAQQVAVRAIKDKGVRFFLQSSYDLSSGLGRHNISLNFDQSQKDDLTPKEQDITTMNSTLGLTTSHLDLPLETGLNLSYSAMKIPDYITDTTGGTTTTTVTSRKINYQTIALTGIYQILPEQLSANATVAPTFGNFQRFLIEAGLSYNITRKQVASLVVQYISYSANSLPASVTSTTDTIISALYRLEL